MFRVVLFFLDISFDKNKRTSTFSLVWYAHLSFLSVFFLHISHSSYHTAEKCIVFVYCIIIEYLYSVYFLFLFFVFFCSLFFYCIWGTVALLFGCLYLFVTKIYSFLPIFIIILLILLWKDIQHIVHDIRYANKNFK